MSPCAGSNPITERLARQPFLVLDGALATELERRGADLHDPLWSARMLLEAPQLIRAVHLDYFRAGADIATTATYQATFEGFARRGLDADAAARLMQSAVRLASEARAEFWADEAGRAGRSPPLLAASIGPYGAMLADGSEYRGGYAVDDATLAAFHRPRLEALAAAGADLVACETLPCLREALVLVRLLEDHPALGAWIGFSCRDGERDSEGEPVSDCAAALCGIGQVWAIGVNCTPPRHVPSILARMRPRADKPLVAYPNSGEAYDAGAKRWTGGADCTRWADQALDWYRAGARLIGGCCRTTPEDIRDLRGLCTWAAVR